MFHLQTAGGSSSFWTVEHAKGYYVAADSLSVDQLIV